MPEQPLVPFLVDVPVLLTVGVGAICAQSSPQCSGWVPRRLCATTASLAQPLTLLSSQTLDSFSIRPLSLVGLVEISTT